MGFSALSVVRGPGELAAMVIDVTKLTFTTRFQFREFIEQAWFITSVTLMPTIPGLDPVRCGDLAPCRQPDQPAGRSVVRRCHRGARDSPRGRPDRRGADHRGAAGSAICSDMGARKIREEIDAMEVLGVDPIARPVVPRAPATVFVSLMIIGIVISAGIGGGYFFTVIVQGRFGRRVPLQLHRARVHHRPVCRDGQGRTLRLPRPPSSARTRASTPAVAPAASGARSTRA
ncbi:ABC transporter permease [Nocardioides sp. B-3]|uniref:ABC transporter permease n=1 Tax=Nocardioides sp. B-3 TaxID=2895565 RepID=UPI003FA5B8B4